MFAFWSWVKRLFKRKKTVRFSGEPVDFRTVPLYYSDDDEELDLRSIYVAYFD